MKRIIIAGGRNFNNYDLLKAKADKYLKPIIDRGEDLIILCGDAEGADKIGERWAIENNVKVEHFPADWKQGKSAGIIRNKQMGDIADGLLAFWDGMSRGTAHMIKYMQDLGKKTLVTKYKTLCIEVKDGEGGF